jgi:hypothetical protein
MRTNPDNKYARALNELGSANNSQDVVNILSKNNIPIKNGRIVGGKKSKKSRKTQKKRKIRKQKGGFEYSGKTKRRRLTVPRSTSSQRSSSQRSSSQRSSSQRSSSQRSSSQPRSTYESQSIVPQKYKARGTKKSKM